MIFAITHGSSPWVIFYACMGQKGDKKGTIFLVQCVILC